MNWVQYKDLLFYLCLGGLVVSSLSLTQEILGSGPTLPFLYFINFFFVTEFSASQEGQIQRNYYILLPFFHGDVLL